MVCHSAQPSYKLFPKDQYSTHPNVTAETKQFTFFNGAKIGATPKIDVPGISDVSRMAYLHYITLL